MPRAHSATHTQSIYGRINPHQPQPFFLACICGLPRLCHPCILCMCILSVYLTSHLSHRPLLVSYYMYSPPLKYIFGMSRLYFTCIPLVSHRILGIPCIPVASLYQSISSHLAADPLYLPLYPTTVSLSLYRSSCIRTYLAVSISSCIPLYYCISPHPTASKTGYGQNYTPGREGYVLLFCTYASSLYRSIYIPKT